MFALPHVYECVFPKPTDNSTRGVNHFLSKAVVGECSVSRNSNAAGSLAVSVYGFSVWPDPKPQASEQFESVDGLYRPSDALFYS